MSGRQVRLTSDRAPRQWREAICPTCGQRMQAFNGAILRYWRERAGIDQRTLARTLGVSGPYLSDLERNRRACPEDIRDAYKRLRTKRAKPRKAR
jgi:hypothetical protein